MAKATKSKKVVEETLPEPIPEITEQPEEIKEEVPEPEIAEQPKEETIKIGQTSAILTDEVKVIEIPLSEAIERGFVKDVVELSKEERIINFMDTRSDGEVKMNDFLKSLYPLPTSSSPAAYLRQGESRSLRGLLTKMQQEGKILFADSQYRKLGDFYYVDGDTETKYHNILTVQIVAKK